MLEYVAPCERVEIPKIDLDATDPFGAKPLALLFLKAGVTAIDQQLALVLSPLDSADQADVRA